LISNYIAIDAPIAISDETKAYDTSAFVIKSIKLILNQTKVRLTIKKGEPDEQFGNKQ